MEPRGESLATQSLVDRLRLVAAMEQQNSGKHFDIALPGSDLSVDDESMGYLPTSHLVGHCLSVSLDALRTVRFVLQCPEADGGIRLPMAGHYSVLRTAIESAALAIWLLEPDERRRRLVRSFQARADDIKHDNQLVKVMTEDLPVDSRERTSQNQRNRRENAKSVRSKRNELRTWAEACAIDPEEYQHGLPGYSEIIWDAATSIGLRSTRVAGTWHMISGLTHPSASRMILASEKEIIDHGRPGSLRVLMTSRPGYVDSSLECAIQLRVAALELASTRGGNDSLAWAGT